MKILLCHNHYQQRGGEDACFEDEAALLERHGEQVIRYTLHNDAIEGMTRLRVAGRTIWSPQAHRELSDLIRRERPAVMHCTNTFPLISPAAYRAARRRGVAVVQSLHNFRITCAGGIFMRDGRVCEKCLGKTVGWQAVRHGCYRGSRLGSATVVAANAVHWTLGSWTRGVDRFIVLTEFARDKFVQVGLPAERIAIKPNFIDANGPPGAGGGGYALFVGRLSREKGIDTLLEAWRRLDQPIPLKIVGDGPMRAQVDAAATGDRRIEAMGARPAARVLELMGEAMGLVLPSLCYEGLPRTIVESFARGTPIIASDLGALPQLVRDGVTGRIVPAGDAAALARAVADHAASSPAARDAMRRAARRTYLDKYTAAANHPMLMAVYRDAIRSRRDAQPTAAAQRSLSPRVTSRP